MRRDIACIFLCITCGAAADTALVARFTFDEGPADTIRDSSGHGNHGTNHGAEYLRDGDGYVLRFASPEAYVDCGDDPSLDLTGPMTIELWLYGENNRQAGGEPGLAGKTTGSYLLAYAGSAWFYVDTGKVRNDCAAPAPIKAWHHVVATFDGRALRTYTDGRLQNTVAAHGARVTSGGNFYLRYPVIWGGKVIPPVVVRMDDVRVYKRALSADEVLDHYMREAESRGTGLTGFRVPKAAAHVVAATNIPVIAIDYGDLHPAPPEGAAIQITLRNAADEVVASPHLAVTHASAVIDWTAARPLTPGPYRYEVRVAGHKPASGHFTVRPLDPVASRPFGDAKMLNNFVAELADVADAGGHVTFTNPRAGWVWVRGGDGESMRYLGKGEHRLPAHGRVTVRAISELIYTEMGYGTCPWVKSYGPYTWDYLDGIGVLANTNVMLIRDASLVDPANLDRWRAGGRRQLFYYNLNWLLRKVTPLTPDAPYAAWSATPAMRDPASHGLMLDELGGHVYPEEYPHFTSAVRRIAADPALADKVFYPYCSDLYASEPARAFARALIDAGYRLAEEEYLLEQPTLAEARAYMNRKLRLGMLRYQDHFRNVASHTVMAMGFISLPQETQSIYPEVDFKVYLDMQMHMLANDPVFRGLFGLLWYHGSYADEEILRWSARLTRHYCIEGRRGRLTEDPYLLPHIANGDFHDDARGWTLAPADDGSIFTARSPRYGWLQGRFQRDVWAAADPSGGGLAGGAGDHFIVMRRSAVRANRITQPVTKLVPGRLYSVRMITADYEALSSGASVERDHHIRFALEDVAVQPRLSFMEIVTNGGGHHDALFKPGNNIHFNWHRTVFRATGETATLTLTDAGGPAGDRIAVNGVELAPYLEDQ